MRKSRLVLGFCFVSLLTFLLANSANAQVVVYNTIHAEPPSTWLGAGIYAAPPNPQFYYSTIATSFVSDGSYQLTRIDVIAVFNQYDLIGYPKGTNSGVVVELLSDDGGQPGTVLESWTVSPPLPPSGYSSPQLLLPTSTISLSDGARYWVAISPMGPYGIAEWSIAPPSPGTLLGSNDGNTWTADGNVAPAFDVWGNPTGLTKFHRHHWRFGQTIRLTAVAGPTSVPPGVPVEAVLGFLDANGNSVGPTKAVSLNPGQTDSLDFTPGANVQGDVLPVVTPLPGTASFNGEIRASVEVIDTLLGIGTTYEAGHISLAGAPLFAPQGIAGGQTMRLTVSSQPSQPCMATLSFEDNMGTQVGPTQFVDLSNGTSASLDLDSAALNLRLGQRTEIQPLVTLGSPAGVGAPSGLACPGSAEVFDKLTGRTETFQPGETNPGPPQTPGVPTPVAAQ